MEIQMPSVCPSCGFPIEEVQYQMRAADEAHTTIKTCMKCPLNYSRLSFDDPGRLALDMSFKQPVNRAACEDRVLNSRRVSVVKCVELTSRFSPKAFDGAAELPNYRYPCSVRQEGAIVRADYYPSGPWSGVACAGMVATPKSPMCTVNSVRVLELARRPDAFRSEFHGSLKRIETRRGTTMFLLDTRSDDGQRYVISCRVEDDTEAEIRRLCTEIHEVKDTWESIYSFASRNFVSTMQNLSPRAWDHKRVQKAGATYTPKVDGERAYVLIYEGFMHMFSKSPGYPHIGWQRVPNSPGHVPVVVDVENVASVGTYLIDMLTDCDGNFSPRSRSWQWMKAQFSELVNKTSIKSISEKPSFSRLADTERYCGNWEVPTDGVVGMWSGTTTARKMKMERSVELKVSPQRTLLTSEDDEVFADMDVPAHCPVGSIVEVRFKLLKDGKKVSYSPLFKREDKSSANSNAAIRGVLSSFSHSLKSDDTRRAEALFWCDMLRSFLLRKAESLVGNKKILLDVGTGTGQSLDTMASGGSLSYILVEPDASRCQMIRKRLGLKAIHTDPRVLMSVISGLKTGRIQYVLMNCKLQDITEEEEVMSALQREVGAVTSFFSCQYTVPELHDISSYWSIPTVCCFYPYDGVEIGQSLVDCLGVQMKRISESECTVKWGGDKTYVEPMTVTKHYEQSFCISKGAEHVPCPDKQVDKDVYNICSKVYIAYS